MDFAIQSLLPKATDRSANGGVVQDDPNKMAEEFAKLLVAQIQNQDPEKPMDTTEIISQNAQFTASLATVRLSNQMAHYQQVSSAMSVIGKPAEYLNPNNINGASTIGIVTGADYSTTPPSLIIDGKLIPMDNILRVDGEIGSQVAGQQLQETTRLKQLEMLGRTVEYFDPNTNGNATGVVDEVDLISDQGLLTVNGVSVPMTNLIRIIN
jgi:flagellar basal-body rod modification protein FlgD